MSNSQNEERGDLADLADSTPLPPISIAGRRNYVDFVNNPVSESTDGHPQASRPGNLSVLHYPNKQHHAHLYGPPTPNLTAKSTVGFEHSLRFDPHQCGPQAATNSPPPPPTPAASPGPNGSRAWGTESEQTEILMQQMTQHFQASSNRVRMSMLARLLGSCNSQQLSFVYQFVTPLLKKDPFTSLPNELCLRILSFIDDPTTLARAAQVSRRWRDLLGDDLTWKNLCFKHEYDRQLPVVVNGVETAPEPVAIATPSLPEYQISRRKKPRSYRSHFKQRFLVDSAWKHRNNPTAKYITEEGGVVTSLHLTDKYIIMALDNTRIHVFDTNGEQQKTLSGHMGGVWAMVPWGDLLVSGGCDRDIRVWNMATGTSVHRMSGHTSTVRCLKMSDERTAISGSRDSFLRVWDIVTGTCVKVLAGHQASVRCLDIHGDIVVSGSYDTTGRVWSISEGRCLTTLQGHFSQIYAIAYDGTRVVTGSLDTNVRIWNPETAECLAVLQGHTSLVGQIQMRGNTLVTGGSDGSVRVWSLETMTPIHRLAAHDNSVTSLQFDDTRVVSGGSDGRVKIWDLKTGNLVRELMSQCEAVWRVAFQSEKCVALALRSNRTVMEVWDFAAPDEDAAMEQDVMKRPSMLMTGGDSGDSQDFRVRPMSAMPYQDSFAPHIAGQMLVETTASAEDVVMDDMPQTAPAHSLSFFDNPEM